MVSPISLYAFALTLVLLAGVVARLGRVKFETAWADGCASLVGASVALGVSLGLFAAAGPPAASEIWGEAGKATLLMSPIGAALALRLRGRRSVPRALVGAIFGLTGTVLWLTLNLRGPRGWTWLDAALVLPGVIVAVASGACLGWWSKRPTVGSASALSFAALLLWTSLGCAGRPESGSALGTLELTLRDAATGETTPARVELLDGTGNAVVPDDALAVFSDCGNVPIHAWVPGYEALQAVWNGQREVPNPYSGTTQFYSRGSMRVELPPGDYSLRVTKGIEYERASETVAVAQRQVTRVNLELRRWIDLARQGWYSADDHLHIPRPHPRFDPRLATWMEAEDLNVANLLQMGLARDVHITPQHGFGPRSAYGSGDTLILSGQENPRTHLLGHAIVLGARRFLDLPSEYLLYDRIWRTAHEEGAVTGYAHWGLGGAEEGLAIWGREALLDFVEVLNLGLPFYDRWYEALDLGIRIGPTAGTDYPCGPSLPGRERFYARLDGPLDAASWLEAVRLGRTFVTNGPVIELAVDGAQPGDEVRLAGSGTVQVRGRVRFDPERDDVSTLELVRGGAVVARVDGPTSRGEIALETALEIDRTSWLALRATGTKRGETLIDLRSFFSSLLTLERRSSEGLLQGLPEGPVPRPSAAHTAAVLITVDGTPSLAEQDRGREVARLWLARLDELERRLADDRMAAWARFPGRGDGVDPRTARANRQALLDAIEAARRHHESRP